jgi:hypothetical protein
MNSQFCCQPATTFCKRMSALVQNATTNNLPVTPAIRMKPEYRHTNAPVLFAVLFRPVEILARPARLECLPLDS